jgi:hypothetical protein
MRRTFAMLAAAALGLFATLPARAQDAPTEVGPVSAGPAPVDHVLKSSFLDQGYINFFMKKGKTSYTFGNVISFTCTAACTLELEVMLQVGGNKTAGNLWDICGYVDKSSTGFTCAYQGALPTDGSDVIGNYAWSVSLSAGTHTAQPEAYVIAPATLARLRGLEAFSACCPLWINGLG